MVLLLRTKLKIIILPSLESFELGLNATRVISVAAFKLSAVYQRKMICDFMTRLVLIFVTALLLLAANKNLRLLVLYIFFMYYYYYY
jgi:hypothetical protein